jgi:NADPH-dependent ferric siderophore reductase
MSQPAPANRPRLLTVKHVQDVSPHLPNLPDQPRACGLPFSCGGAHVKIMLPRPDQREIVLPHPPTRASLARSRPETRHSHLHHTRVSPEGAGARHRLRPARRGHPPVVSPCTPNRVTGSPSRPGRSRPHAANGRALLHGGDLTALPAISAMVEVMPAMPAPYRPAGPPSGRRAGSVAAGRRRPALVRGPEQAATLVAHFTAQPMVAEGSYFWFGGEESLSCRCAATSDAPWMPSASGSTQSPTGAAARMKTPTIRTGRRDGQLIPLYLVTGGLLPSGKRPALLRSPAIVPSPPSSPGDFIALAFETNTKIMTIILNNCDEP